MNVSARITHWIKYFVAIALSLLFAQATFAQASENQQIAIEGTLTDSSGNPIDLTGAQLVFYVLTNSGCYLYGESTSAAGDSQGNILHRIGSSTLVAGSPSGFTQNIFFGSVSGTTTFAGNNCVAAAADVRLVQVYYQAQNITANLKLGTVPYAHNATMLNGKNAADFLQVTNDSNTLFYNGSAGQFLTRAASGGLTWSTPTLTAAQVTTALGYTPASTTTSLTASSITTALGYTPANSSTLTNYTLLSNNLSDLTSATVARTNLGLGSLATQSTVLLTSDVSGVLPAANGGSKWSSHVSGAYYLNNISIGTSSVLSSTKLYVESNASSQVAYFKNTSTTGYGVRIDVGNSDPSYYALNVKNSGSSIFMVQNDGNIGVGTMTPTARIHIAAGSASQAPFKFTSGSLLATPASGTLEYDGLLYITDETNVRRTIATGSTNTSIDNIATINSPGNLTLATSGVVNLNGSLGIGTVAPASRLHVFSSAAEIARFDGSDTGGYLAFTRNSSPKGFIGYLSGSSTFFNNEIANAMSIRSETAVQLGTGATAHLTVTSNGHVGIGTTSPTTTLTVSGPIRTTAAVEFGDGTVQSTSAFAGYERINASCNATTCVATCSTGKKILGGGCYAGSAAASLKSSFPSSDNQWQCEWTASISAGNVWAICTKM